MAAPPPVPTTQLGEFVQRQLGPDVIDLAAGQPSPSLLPLGLVAAAAAHRFGAPGADPLLLQYGSERGYASFRAALAAFLASEAAGGANANARAASADDLMVTAGVSHGVDLCCRRLAAPGDCVLVERPTYFLLRPILEQNRLHVIDVPTDGAGVDVGALERLLEARARGGEGGGSGEGNSSGGSSGSSGGAMPRLLYTVPVHSNPRGATLPLERRKRLIALAHRFGFDIIGACTPGGGVLQALLGWGEEGRSTHR